MADGFMMIRFKSEEDQAPVMDDLWLVAGQLLAMEKWMPDFILGIHTVSRTVVWVRLPGLPLEYWDREMILAIVAAAERPMELDSISSRRRRLGFARAKVEVDSLQPLVPGTLVEVRQRRFWQDFVFEDLPGLCYLCARMGHQASECRFHEVGKSAAPVAADGLGVPLEEEAAECQGDGERTVYGPWMTVSRASMLRGGDSRRVTGRKMVTEPPTESDRGPVPANSAPSLAKAGSSSPVSPSDSEGWQKPKKIARHTLSEQSRAIGNNAPDVGKMPEAWTESELSSKRVGGTQPTDLGLGPGSYCALDRAKVSSPTREADRGGLGGLAEA
ncbi:uncharacterized protein LOC120108712 [Phoenix dactylifera]|uniref:Uncharacterized protein LOC120108712 n=1 Tax=Phoenix dactylifera TaxID=42345 RepID=A0A8B9A3C0_PHODC|nr:uncharacterized protein LOC120108712 [Phoenix dactylifera]